MLRDSIINDFFKLKSHGTYVGIELQSGAIGNNFYGVQLETNGLASIWVSPEKPEDTSSVTSNQFFGGVVENNIHAEIMGSPGRSCGLLVERPGFRGTKFFATYFERCDRHFVISHNPAGNAFFTTFDGCRFFDVKEAAAGLIDSVARVKAVDCIYQGKPLIELAHSSARYVGDGNTNDTGVAEHIGSVGRAFVQKPTGDGFIQHDVRGLKVGNFIVPGQQNGRTTVPGGSSAEVTFPQAFAAHPRVITQMLGVAGSLRPEPIRIDTPTPTGFVVYNDNAGPVVVDWIAFTDASGVL